MYYGVSCEGGVGGALIQRCAPRIIWVEIRARRMVIVMMSIVIMILVVMGMVVVVKMMRMLMIRMMIMSTAVHSLYWDDLTGGI